MQCTDLYHTAHLVVAAIRVHEHLNSAPPSIEDIGRALSFSPERSHLLCKKLEDLGIIERVEGGFGERLCIKNHHGIEDIPRDAEESAIEKEIKKFRDERKHLTQKIESLQNDHKEKKKSLFAELEKKLKQDLEKK